MRLKPADARQLCGELHLLARHGLFVRPDADTLGGEALPGEQRARVQFAQRCDVTVTDDVARIDGVALADVLEQHDQGLNLILGVRIPEPAGRGVLEARIDDFDTDGAGIQPGPAVPLAFTGVPGTLAFVHQLENGGALVITDQVMTADFTMGQQLQRTLH
ncbi:hypothetical protein D3C85_1111940 [compost metagenome]